MSDILLESNLNFNFPNKIYKQFEKLNSEQEKRKLLTDPEFKRKYLKGISPEMFEIIYKSIINDGIDVKTNKFLDYLSSFDKKTFKNNEDKFKYIFDATTNNKINLKSNYLKNESLFNRDFNDFKYTINAFELVHNKTKLKQAFYDTSKISDKEFFNGEAIKDAGINGESGDTIYNVVDKWLANGNEKNANTESDDGRNLYELVKNKQFNYKFFENIILMNFDNLISDIEINYGGNNTISSILYPFYIGLKLKDILENLHSDDIKLEFNATKHGAIEKAKSQKGSKKSLTYPGTIITYPVKSKKDNKQYYKTTLYYAGYFDENYEDEIPLELESHEELNSKLYKANINWAIKVFNFLKKVKIEINPEMDKEEQIAYCAMAASVQCWNNDLMYSDSYSLLR